MDAEAAWYDVWVSPATVLEVERGTHPHREQVVRLVRSFPIVPDHETVREVAMVYIDNRLMPDELEGDARHLAFASFYEFEYLLTWNCNHLANANKRRHIEVINGRLGLRSPAIVTPQMLVREKL